MDRAVQVRIMSLFVVFVDSRETFPSARVLSSLPPHRIWKASARVLTLDECLWWLAISPRRLSDTRSSERPAWKRFERSFTLENGAPTTICGF